MYCISRFILLTRISNLPPRGEKGKKKWLFLTCLGCPNMFQGWTNSFCRVCPKKSFLNVNAIELNCFTHLYMWQTSDISWNVIPNIFLKKSFYFATPFEMSRAGNSKPSPYLSLEACVLNILIFYPFRLLQHKKCSTFSRTESETYSYIVDCRPLRPKIRVSVYVHVP